MASLKKRAKNAIASGTSPAGLGAAIGFAVGSKLKKQDRRDFKSRSGLGKGPSRKRKKKD